MITLNNIVTSAKEQEILYKIKELIKECDTEFSEWDRVFNILNRDMTNLIYHKKHIDDLVRFHSELSEVEQKYINQYIAFDVKNNFKLILYTIFKIMDKFEAEDNYTAKINIHSKSIQSGKLKELIELVNENKDLFIKLKWKHFDLFPTDEVFTIENGSELELIDLINNRYTGIDLNLGSDLKKLKILYDTLKLKEFRNSTMCHLDSTKGLAIDDLDFNYYHKEEFQKFINDLDLFLQKCYLNIFNISFLRVLIGGDHIINSSKIYYSYIKMEVKSLIEE